MTRALEGIRILDATIMQQGPAATALLGDLGAEVIKIEDPETGDPGRAFIPGFGMEKAGLNTYFETLNRGKKSIAINLRVPEGRDLLHKLVKKVDVFTHNFRPAVAKKLGMDYDTLSRHNPQLVYCWASAWGPRGPIKDQPSLDLTGQARGGIMSIAGEPPAPGEIPGIADQGGAFVLALAISTGLLARNLHGVGQQICTSQLGSVIALAPLFVSGHGLGGGVGRQISRTKRRNPLWNVYRCADERWIALGMAWGDRAWEPFCRSIGHPDLLADPRFKTDADRAQHREECIQVLSEIFATQPREFWVSRLQQADLLCAPVHDYSDVVRDEQALVNGYVVEVEYPGKGARRVVGMPIEFGKTPGQVRVPAPKFGEHTDEVLRQYLMLTEEELLELRVKGALH